jgi:hypothetical protein
VTVSASPTHLLLTDARSEAARLVKGMNSASRETQNFYEQKNGSEKLYVLEKQQE